MPKDRETLSGRYCSRCSESGQQIFRAALWKEEITLTGDIFPLLKNVGLYEEEVEELRDTVIAGLITELHHSGMLEVLRAFCNKARDKIVSETGATVTLVYFHLFLYELGKIVASIL